MRYDGVTAKGLAILPHTAQRFLDGSGTVSNLYGADWPTRNRCGYYETVPAMADPGMVIMESAWPSEPTDGVFAQTIVSQITQAEYDAQIETAAQAEHDADTPGGTLAWWSKREKCLLLITYKLAQQHWPNMTKQAFLDNVKAEWDSLK